MPERNRGNTVQFAYGLATMAIALYLTAIVLGELNASFSSSLASSTVASSGLGNITYYAFVALRIGSIGLLVYASMNMFGWFGMSSRRGGRGR